MRDMVARGRSFLEAKGFESPRLEAELLVAHALGTDRLSLFLALDRPVSEEEITRARDLLVRRAKGEPTAYLTGSREFYGRPFTVGPGVLVPRPETELLVDRAREALADVEAPRIADLGTGSGCLAVTLALELQGARVTASDLSAEALAFARGNAADLGAEVTFLEGDGIAPLAGGAPYDLVVSNPPYVDPRSASETLGPGVLEFEPASALFSPEGDPDHWARRLVEEAVPLLAPGGVLLVELGFDQGERMLALVRERGLQGELHADFAGHGRVLEVRAG